VSSSSPALEFLVVGARALAHADRLDQRLEIILGSLAEQLGIESAAVFIRSGQHDSLEPVATFGLSAPALAGLQAAVGNPAHPIARTATDGVATFDVAPTAPGGPALRSHLPLTITRDGNDVVLGVLALAHERPIGVGLRPLLVASGDLAAVAIERSRSRLSRT
jgi:hypothetical protein